MKLTYRPEKCIGCHLCELACSGCKEGLFNPALARLQITSKYKSNNLINEAKLCDLCLKCVEACSAEAIRFTGGRLDLSRDDCVNCNVCIEECPTGVLRPDGQGFPLLCDGCQGDPYCAKWCPQGALVSEEVN
ncbi:4Fe-4S binding protein [Desulfoscipio geothermicus]|uniref:Fe-S-cluster-containing hydrogenase component 2 n=1 Tax=Desulfoscipio geothermicus DSM 3669 TaxID=1121426 RepID=A0A1I6CY32_9FIRM|nr:4Fe-4S binding protein [Desulfoscipio geothermicus]SFQ98032.1 Fe-S-cluster-containing hydrogenase component 2 [Desulfoscipio geothermicus DSM 3669]